MYVILIVTTYLYLLKANVYVIFNQFHAINHDEISFYNMIKTAIKQVLLIKN